MTLRITIALIVVVLARDVLAQDETTVPPAPLDPIDMLLQEVEDLRHTVDALRAALAESKLETAVTQRDLDELRQFIEDRHEFGRDFEQYRGLKADRQRDEQERRLAAAREQRETRQAERTAKQREFQERRTQRDAEAERVQGFHEAGFSSLGFDVFMGNAAFNYQSTDGGVGVRSKWDPFVGRFLRAYPFPDRIDFSSMTISGSVLNAAAEARDIGIAVTFFDEAGSQVGAEIVQVNNARPQVPYPFTATIAMALDRPFATASTYVLYADPSVRAPH